LPAGWKPDCVLLDLSRGAVPAGVWSAPVPVVALAGDWRLRWHYLRHVLPRCDLVVADPEGAQRFRALGLAHVHGSTLWGEGIGSGEPPAPEVGRDIDVLFPGAFHPAAQRERLPWVARLARLADRWRVQVQPADGQGDGELLRRARILFHHGGEAERPSPWRQAVEAGALLFLPAGAPAPLPLFRDRQECVRYTAEDLGPLLEYYLRHEDERRRLAEEAQRRLGAVSPAAPWAELLGVAEMCGQALAERTGHRPAWGRREELLARAWQALGGGADPTLAGDLRAALGDSPTDVSLRHALGLAAALAPAAPPAERAAAAAVQFEEALRGEPRHVLAGLNHAEAFAAAGRAAEAADQARRTLAVLDGLPDLGAALLDGGHYPPGLDVFRAEWERAAWEHAGDPAGEARAKRGLLVWRLHGLLGRLTGELPHRYEAALARPDLPATRAALGSALLRAGRAADAVPHLRRATEGNPLDAAPARLLSEALGAVGRWDEQGRLHAERRRLRRVASDLVPAEPWFEEQPGLATPTPAGRRQRVSLCMIVKEEEANLPACLASVADLVDEIVIVDTGSADRTREAAAGFGARVYDFPWCDSFAAARNESLRHATGDWAFWLDADDRLDEANRGSLRALFARLRGEVAAYLMRQHSLPDAVTGSVMVVDQAKLFRLDPRVRWDYRVHEQILPAVLRLGGAVRPTDIVIHHTGYQDPGLRRRKLERNLRLLLLDHQERPDDPLTLFNLGSLYLDQGRFAEAVPLLQRSLEVAPPGYSLLARAHGLLTHGLRRLGRQEEALAVCRRGRACFPGDADLLFYEAQLLKEAGQAAAAEACLRQLLAGTPGPALGCSDLGLRGYKGRHQLALLCRDGGRPEEAEAQWRAALAERPDFVPGWLGLADLCLARGREADLRRDLEGLAARPGAGVAAAALRARLRLHRGEFAAARAALEGAVTAAPHSFWPRALLGRVLLQEGRDLGAAARALREALALDPHQEDVRRQLARLEGRAKAGATPEGVAPGHPDAGGGR
jgi:tetratricopeptide (TPR) repeat protein